MALITLPPKDGNPVIDSGHLLAYLVAAGATVNGGTVIGNADGSVTVDADADLTAMWAAYAVLAPPQPPATQREQLIADLEPVSTIAGLKTYIAETLIPAIVPE